MRYSEESNGDKDDAFNYLPAMYLDCRPRSVPTAAVLVDLDPNSSAQTVIVESGNTAYVSNFDTARRDNLAADGKTSLDGIGTSIIQITQ